LFAFQIYGDFSGYSDIAIGTAKLFGIKLMQNFRTPYFARNIADFWRRWHISLTSWLTTYIFIPLSIRWRDLDKWGVVMAIMLTFAVSGLWHGANWTFILWGIYHGLLFVPLIITKSTNKYNKANYKLSDIPKMLLTFLLVVLGLIIFRAPSLNACGEYMIGICDMSLFTWPMVENIVQLVATILAIIVMMVMEWRNQLPNRWWIYYLLIIAIWWFAGQDMDFIYFQF
jgi:D-alanyl-lipoteichoic acid acyltransferase DltB (MBOAT superfamily)